MFDLSDGVSQYAWFPCREAHEPPWEYTNYWLKVRSLTKYSSSHNHLKKTHLGVLLWHLKKIHSDTIISIVKHLNTHCNRMGRYLMLFSVHVVKRGGVSDILHSQRWNRCEIRVDLTFNPFTIKFYLLHPSVHVDVCASLKEISSCISKLLGPREWYRYLGSGTICRKCILLMLFVFLHLGPLFSSYGGSSSDYPPGC